MRFPSSHAATQMGPSSMGSLNGKQGFEWTIHRKAMEMNSWRTEKATSCSPYFPPYSDLVWEKFRKCQRFLKIEREVKIKKSYLQIIKRNSWVMDQTFSMRVHLRFLFVTHKFQCYDLPTNMWDNKEGHFLTHGTFLHCECDWHATSFTPRLKTLQWFPLIFFPGPSFLHHLTCDESSIFSPCPVPAPVVVSIFTMFPCLLCPHGPFTI